MEYRNLGRSGLKVSNLCLGGNNWGGATPEEDAIRIIHRALDAGINFLDTAITYTGGRSEEVIGKALRGRRDGVLIATKGHGAIGQGPNDRGNSRHYILRAVEISLRRLETDYIDLYYMHSPDPSTPIEETLRTLNDLVAQGKIRYLACSNYPAWQMCEALHVGQRYGWETFVCDQPPYSLFNREIEREVIPFCQRYGVALATYSPLASGWLSGKYRPGEPIPEGTRGARSHWDLESPASKRRFEVLGALERLARERGVPVSHVAIAWLTGNPAITSPILGARTMEQFEENLAAASLQLTAEERAVIDALVPRGTRV
jgi:aryl-alcohol dehydrogenase-like predicted oxidoreductase